MRNTRTRIQIEVAEEDRKLQRILWRSSPEKPLQQFYFTVVIFGLKPSPYLATKTLERLAEDEGDRFPEAAKVLRHCFYVDDLSTSLHSEEQAIEIYHQLKEMLATAQFEIVKWATNSQEVLDHIPEEDREVSDSISLNEDQTVKTLGLRWSPKSDIFSFAVNIDVKRPHTKREILSEISKIYDPLGFISPVVIKAKILIQKIWMLNLGWDDAVPQGISDEWNQIAETFTLISEIKINRPLTKGKFIRAELHGFCDGSGSAYGACIYLRVVYSNHIECVLIAAKGKVAPIKAVSSAKLEMLSAMVLLYLMIAVKDALSIKIDDVKYWTDSAIVLWWINKPPNAWKLFVKNRVAIIQEHSSPNQWAHVRTELNPADCCSRGILPIELVNHNLWWHGPPWLSEETIIQPEIPGMPKEAQLEASSAFPLLAIHYGKSTTMIHSIMKIGNYTKIVRTLARVHQVLREKTFKTTAYPTPQDLKKAELTLFRLVQQECFVDAITALKDGKFNDPSLKSLKSLNPFLDENGLLRVGGRIEHANLPFEQKHPLIMSGKHEIMRLYIFDVHKNLAHASKRTIYNYIRSVIWMIQGMKSIKSVLDKCLLCHRYKAPPVTQLMGQLPASRVTYSRPFTYVGVDLAGPFTLRNFVGRTGQFKSWICLFVCQLTRAIHLEIVTTLSAEGFLLAFRRFIGRRGKPCHMYSDNGTNFVGAFSSCRWAISPPTTCFKGWVRSGAWVRIG